MNYPGGVFGASQLHEAPAQGESLEIISFHWARRHITLGGLLSRAKPPQAESERNYMFHWTGRSITPGWYSVYLMSAAGHLDLSVARSVSHPWQIS
jgi:hypothetical protein